MGSPLSVWHQDWIGVWGVCWLGPCFVLFVVFAVVCGSWLDCPVRMAAAIVVTMEVHGWSGAMLCWVVRLKVTSRTFHRNKIINVIHFTC